MPLLPGLRQVLEIPVSDHVNGSTVVKQKARFTKLTHVQQADGVCTVVVSTEVTMYGADPDSADGYGPALQGSGFFSYPKHLSADNNTVVDVATGAILAIRRERTAEQAAHTDEEWAAICASYPQPVMLQGDYFEYVRQNEPIKIADLILLHMQQADAMGRYK